jgi:hypothetical protein
LQVRVSICRFGGSKLHIQQYRENNLSRTTVAQIGASDVQWRKLTLLGVCMSTPDEVAAVIGPYLGELLLIILPDDNDDRVRVIDGALEARIWKGKQDYIYEIASRRTGVVLARGSAGGAYAALERSIPLLLLFHEHSGAMVRAA